MTAQKRLSSTMNALLQVANEHEFRPDGNIWISHIRLNELFCYTLLNNHDDMHRLNRILGDQMDRSSDYLKTWNDPGCIDRQLMVETPSALDVGNETDDRGFPMDIDSPESLIPSGYSAPHDGFPETEQGPTILLQVPPQIATLYGKILIDVMELVMSPRYVHTCLRYFGSWKLMGPCHTASL
jgi:hypothetical protein